jgi:ketosteroid isomerase-like protein
MALTALVAGRSLGAASAGIGGPMEHPNAELYRRLTAAFQAGDIETVQRALAPGLRWHEAGSADVMGRDAVVQQMSGAITRLDGDIAVHDVLANDEHVVALIRVALRKPDGSEVDYPAVEVAHMSDGLVTERWSFMDACPPDVDTFFSDVG